MKPMSKSPRTALRVSALLALVAVATLLNLQAQDQGPGVIRVDVNLVMLDATVKTKAGEIMANLKKDDFEVREDGVVQKIDVFSRDELPLNVALVLDLSDSIGPFLGPLRDAATTALASLKPDDQVALFTFSTEAELRVAVHDRQNAKSPSRSAHSRRAAPPISTTASSSPPSISSARRRTAAA